MELDPQPFRSKEPFFRPGGASASSGRVRLDYVLKALLAFALIVLLAACGGQSTPAPTTGKLTVNITDLLAGADADVTVTGPDSFARALTATTTLEDLEPGSYEVSADDVTTPSGVYVASVSGSPTTVEVGKTATASVAYERFGATMVDRQVGVPFGGIRELHLEIVRHGAFDGEVTVNIDAAGLPAGLSVSDTDLTIPADETTAIITFISDGTMTALNTATVLPVAVTAGGKVADAELTVEVGAIVLNADDAGIHSLRYWVTNAPAGGSGSALITFDADEFAAPRDIQLASDITIGMSLEIQGPTDDAGEPYVTIRGAADGTFSVKDSITVGISNLVLAGANAPTTNGAAIMNQGTLTLDNLLVTDNSGARGAGVYNATIGELTISNSSLLSNSSNSDGGAVHNAGIATIIATRIEGNESSADGGGFYNGGTATVTGSHIEDNTSLGSGGGIFNDANQKLTVVDTQIIGNNAVADGGGVHNAVGGVLTIRTSIVSKNELSMTGVHSGGGLNNLGEALIEDSTFSDNRAFGGGGIGMSNSAELQLIGSTVSGNEAATNGGGVFSNGVIEITNSTFAGNKAVRGAGLFVSSNVSSSARIAFSTFSANTASIAGAGISYSGELWLRGTIVAGNQLDAGATGGPDVHRGGTRTMDSAGYNLIGDLTGSGFLLKPGDKSGLAPVLRALQDNGGPTHTLALQAGSPALDAVPQLACVDLLGASLKFDQRGQPRPGAGSAPGQCDMGAYEAQ